MNGKKEAMKACSAIKYTICVLTALLCCAVTAVLLMGLLTGTGSESHIYTGSAAASEIMDGFDMYLTGSLSDAMDGARSVEKKYWLRDSVLTAPEPDRSRFGETEDPASLQWLLDDAAELLDGQETLFSTQTVTMKNSKVRYYLDDTIFVVIWKQVIDNIVYTISEVKIAHPSQFRRFLADGEFGSDNQYLTSEMAAGVNAVVASAGDYYKYRREGVIVYNSKVERFSIDQVDTCGIDENGDLVFMRRRQFTDQEAAQQFVEDNHIRFSLSFGPILVDNYERCEPADYVLGEVNEYFSRAALCQMDELHYLVVAANGESYYFNYPDIHTFAQRIYELGCEKAYTIDGGQTATIVMNDKVVNQVNYGPERQISDIFYFATALPSQNE